MQASDQGTYSPFVTAAIELQHKAQRSLLQLSMDSIVKDLCCDCLQEEEDRLVREIEDTLAATYSKDLTTMSLQETCQLIGSPS